MVHRPNTAHTYFCVWADTVFAFLDGGEKSLKRTIFLVTHEHAKNFRFQCPQINFYWDISFCLLSMAIFMLQLQTWPKNPRRVTILPFTEKIC
jgi:hypothetical protein